MVAGFLSGIHLASQAPLSASLMRGLFSSPVSIIPMLSAALIPYLFSAFAVYFSCRKVLYYLAFAKCLCFGYAAGGITGYFAGAGWLVRTLLMFHSSISLPVLAMFWFRHIPEDQGFSGRFAALVGLLTVFAVWLDYRYILPILAMI